MISILCVGTQLFMVAPLIDVNCNDLYCVGAFNYLWYAPLIDVNLQWYLLCGDTQLFMLCTFNWSELEWSLYCKGALIYLWYAPLIDVSCNDLYTVWGHSIIYGMHL